MPEKKFNIFQVAGIWKAEEIHTSVIAELLDPQSAFHDMGAVFLRIFLRKAGIELPEEEIGDAQVQTEVPTSGGRRIDMVISTETFYLPFEVKIWAGDQDAQLRDYYDFAKGQRQQAPRVYYLTPDGRPPSKRSRRDLKDAQICRLSFGEHILPWLEDCMRVQGVPADVLEIMGQLRDNIQGGPGDQKRSGIQGFSRWKEDVLSAIYQELSEAYSLPWTECTANYETFTLNKAGALEFALRIRKEREDQMRLYLICGITGEDGKPDYAAAGAYISENAQEFSSLLNETFKEGGAALGLRTSPAKSIWDRLSEKACYEDAEKCCCAVRDILGQMQPGPRQALEKRTKAEEAR